MEKERPTHLWTSDDTNLFFEILADLVNYFTGTLQRGVIIAEFKENIQFKEKKSKNFKGKKKETKFLVKVEALS